VVIFTEYLADEVDHLSKVTVTVSAPRLRCGHCLRPSALMMNPEPVPIPREPEVQRRRERNCREEGPVNPAALALDKSVTNRCEPQQGRSDLRQWQAKLILFPVSVGGYHRQWTAGVVVLPEEVGCPPKLHAPAACRDK